MLTGGDPLTEIFTVDNHADGPYLYLKLLEQDRARAEDALALLRWNGGGPHSSGVGIADIDFLGNVHPDQFWMGHTLGNVKERPFSEIWQDGSDPLLTGLRNRAPLLEGRCGACQWKDVCGGSFRVRAMQVHGNPWAADPGCYLTDEECGLTPGSRIREPTFVVLGTAVVAIVASGLVNARLRGLLGGGATARPRHLFQIKLIVATALILTFLFALPLLKRVKRPALRGRLFTTVHVAGLALGVIAAALGILITG